MSCCRPPTTRWRESLNAANGNQSNGLVPAWCDADGKPNGGAFMTGSPTHYQYDSCRTPFRFGMDWCLFGDTRAKDYVAKTTTFFSGIGATNIVDGYDLNGTPRPEFQKNALSRVQSAAFVGPAGVGAMGSMGAVGNVRRPLPDLPQPILQRHCHAPVGSGRRLLRFLLDRAVPADDDRELPGLHRLLSGARILTPPRYLFRQSSLYSGTMRLSGAAKGGAKSRGKTEGDGLTAPALSVNTDAAPMLGAEVVEGGTRFRLFADRARLCQVRLVDDAGGEKAAEQAVEKALYDLQRLSGGYHELTVAGAGHGTLYQFVLDGEAFPDPYARFLPRGVHGPAMVVESKYAWRNGDGVSRPMGEQVIYELHVGTFTPEGTYRAARGRLQALQDLGVTTIELMPLSSFAGRRGWGYDGVAHFAPHPQYGTPDDLREFIDDAHGMGLSVLLDVVYNHFGPAGNYLRSFSPHYFSSEVKNAWGDGPNCAHPSMRGYMLANVRYWLTEFRFDGLRLDATHAIADPSPVHVLKEVTELAHALMPRKLVIAEDESNDPGMVVARGMDGVWADDFHHVAHVILTGESDGYYASYRG